MPDHLLKPEGFEGDTDPDMVLWLALLGGLVAGFVGRLWAGSAGNPLAVGLVGSWGI